MRTLKLVLAATAAFAFSANAQDRTGPHGMGNPPNGYYQPAVITNSTDANGITFHAGGVAACDGCHVMHNAAGGYAKSTNDHQGEPAWSSHVNAYLLQGSDQSSTCLICHGATGTKGGTSADDQFVVGDLNVTNSNAIPQQRSPGGDFGWTRVTFGPAAGGVVSSVGERHGHNVAARDFGWDTDSRFLTAPGGTFTVNGGNYLQKFACSSCHDPHGRYRLQGDGTLGGTAVAGPFVGSANMLPTAGSGSYGAEPVPATYAVGVYRLLGGNSFAPVSKPGFPFTSNPPVAVAPTYYNKTEGTGEVRVQYVTGMSEWCKNCHPDIHSEGYASGFSGMRHPASSTSTLMPAQVTAYNTYISSGNYGASQARYTSLVPFEQGIASATTHLGDLRTAANGVGNVLADTTKNVMCLSCHRAHASAFDSMVRWDQNATFLTNGTGFSDGLYDRTIGAGNATAAGYYDRAVGTLATANGSTMFGPYQRSLCNKCHAKD